MKQSQGGGSRELEVAWFGWCVKFKGKRGPELRGAHDNGFCMPCLGPRLYSSRVKGFNKGKL